MTMKASTGLINYMLDTGSLKAAFTNCTISCYTGAQPATADDAIGSATLLGTASIGGNAFTPGSPTNGLNFEANAVLNVISKAAAEDWKINCVLDGTLGWFRIKGNAVDNNLASTTLPRIDGTIGISSGDMLVGSLTAAPAKLITIDSCNLNGV